MAARAAIRHPAARGLTLLELVIVMAVLAVLGAMALPGLGTRLDQQRLYTAAETLRADLQEARFEAARQGRPLHLVAQVGQAWCWAVTQQADCPCGQGQPCELRSARPQDHASVQLVQAQPLEINAQGLPVTPASHTLESRRGLQLRVDVQALGRARICTLRGPAALTARYPAC